MQPWSSYYIAVKGYNLQNTQQKIGLNRFIILLYYVCYKKVNKADRKTQEGLCDILDPIKI